MSRQPITEAIDADIEDLVPAFLEHRRRDLVQIRHALEAGDMAQVYKIGHTVSGSSGSFGFHGLAALGKALQESTDAADAAALARILDEMAYYLDAVQPHFH